jgi:hypothetical protein
MNKKYLNIVLYYLIDRSTVSDQLISSVVHDYSINYTEEERQGILQAIDVAIKNPNIDLHNSLPGIELGHKDIVSYLSRLYEKITTDIKS